jgi:biopolymer transport protein TolQ
VDGLVVAPGVILGQSPTFLQLVSDAGLFAKAILLILLCMSVIAWGVALDKLRQYRRVERQARAIRQDARSARSVHELFTLLDAGYTGPLMAILRECRRALQRAGDDLRGRDYLIADVQRAAEKAILESLQQLEKHLVVLSTTTTASPFIGLLGTCWGIMVAFMRIGAQGSANLSVVAPGIAEALIVTIAGLGTAIPALVFYNMLTNRVRVLESEMESFTLVVVDLLERDIRGQPQDVRR